MSKITRKLIACFADFLFSIARELLLIIIAIILIIQRKKFYPVYAEKCHQMLLKAERLFRKLDPTETYPSLHTSLRRNTIALHFNRSTFDPNKDIDEYFHILDQFPISIEVCLTASLLSDSYLRHDLEDSLKGFHYCYNVARRYLQAPASQRAPTTLSWRLLSYFLVPSIAISAGSCARILQWYLNQSCENESLLSLNRVRGAKNLAEVLGMEKDYFWYIYHEVYSEVRSWTSKDTPPPLKLRKRRNTDHKN